jgi:hypothetical protein
MAPISDADIQSLLDRIQVLRASLEPAGDDAREVLQGRRPYRRQHLQGPHRPAPRGRLPGMAHNRLVIPRDDPYRMGATI